MHIYIGTHACMDAYIHIPHTNMHTYIHHINSHTHTHIHTCIHAYLS